MELPVLPVPEDIQIIETDFKERQDQLREIDRQRKIDDPNFQGAFHTKKKQPASKKSFDDQFKRTKKRQKKSNMR